MKINSNTIRDIFVEYGITNNVTAYDPYSAESMQGLRKVVTRDAKRFLKATFGQGYHLNPYLHTEDLTEENLADYFFSTMMRKGIKNISRKGWHN